jgi:Tfp pilus assembly protein PilE
MSSFRRWINSGWHVIALPAWYLLIVFIIVSVLASCDLQTCGYYTNYVARLEKCVESPACTFTNAEFYEYNAAVMRRDANCGQ